MINIWSFLFLQAKREIDSQKHGIKFFLFIFVLFIWFFLFQLEWGLIPEVGTLPIQDGFAQEFLLS